ncbi:MAG: acyl-CoA dehydrogenase family protein, partial [Myxococcota bacterium]
MARGTPMKILDQIERQRSWSDEERAVLAQVRRVAEEIIAPAAARVDESGEFPWENVEALNA